MIRQHFVHFVLKLVPVFLYELLNGGVVELLIEGRVFCVHINFIVLECKTFFWVLIEYNVKLDHVQLFASEKFMLLHFKPARSFLWIMLHGLVQELKALYRYLNVIWPTPGSFLQLVIQCFHRFTALRSPFY